MRIGGAATPLYPARVNQPKVPDLRFFYSFGTVAFIIFFSLLVKS